MSSQNFDLRDKFLNLEDPAVYRTVEPKAAGKDALNFVVEFSPNTVEIAFDLSADEFSALLDTNIPQDHIRWM